jgi:hypothetical protein
VGGCTGAEAGCPNAADVDVGVVLLRGPMLTLKAILVGCGGPPTPFGVTVPFSGLSRSKDFFSVAETGGSGSFGVERGVAAASAAGERSGVLSVLFSLERLLRTSGYLLFVIFRRSLGAGASPRGAMVSKSEVRSRLWSWKLGCGGFSGGSCQGSPVWLGAGCGGSLEEVA